MATYFVDDATGLDSDTGLTEALAWKTIDKAMNTVAAGDKVWVKGTNDYTETATIDTVGTDSAWIVFEGYTSSTGDGGKATIDGGSSRANGIVTALGTSYYIFRNIIVETCTGDGWKSTGTDNINFENCESNSNGTDGWDGWDRNILWFNCQATSNTSNGFHGGTNIGHVYVACRAYASGASSFVKSAAGGVFYLCESFSAATYGFDVVPSIFGAGAIFNCTVDGDAKDTNAAFNLSSASFPMAVMNNIAYDCTTGISLRNILDSPSKSLVQFNLLNSNTTDYSDQGEAGTGDQTGAPNFTDEANQDYTLGSGSAAINKGIDGSAAESPGMDIGAHQSADAGGGGAAGIIKMAGDGGGMVG